jgi:hypothetical protein
MSILTANILPKTRSNTRMTRKQSKVSNNVLLDTFEEETKEGEDIDKEVEDLFKKNVKLKRSKNIKQQKLLTQNESPQKPKKKEKFNYNIIDIYKTNRGFENIIDKYVGDSINGKRSGYGVALYSNRIEYKGAWIDDCKHGMGIMKYPNNNMYFGPFEIDIIVGKGKMNFGNGDKYEGEFVADKMTGYGVMTYENGDIYEGNWLDNTLQGLGKFTYSNGDNYQGYYSKDYMEGIGIDIIIYLSTLSI